MSTHQHFAATGVLLASLVPAGVVSAQGVTPRSFLPRDYTVELRADMAAIVESGIWDAVERTPLLRMGLEDFRGKFGFDLAEVHRVSGGAEWSVLESRITLHSRMSRIVPHDT